MASFSCPLALGLSFLQAPHLLLHCCRHHCWPCCLDPGAGSAFPCQAADSRSSACSDPWLSGSNLHGTCLKGLVRLHLHRPRESPRLWKLVVLAVEPLCPLGVHWQSRCSLTQSPIPHWPGLSSGLTGRETWQLPGEAVGALLPWGGPPPVPEPRLTGIGKRACPRPPSQHSPVPASASGSEVVCPAAEPSRVASFWAAPHLPHPGPCYCLHCCLRGPQGTEAL